MDVEDQQERQASERRWRNIERDAAVILDYLADKVRFGDARMCGGHETNAKANALLKQLREMPIAP